MAFNFFVNPKDKTKKVVLENKPQLLMHTSPTIPEKMYGIKPTLNKAINSNCVFATDDEKLANIYALQPFFKFRFGNGEYGVIITGNNHNLLKLDDKIAYIYFIDSKNFEPQISNDGKFNHEWISANDEYIRKDISPKKVMFNDILRSGVQVFWINNLNTLVEIDKEMGINTTGEQKIEYLKEQTNWKPDKVMYINQYRDICPVIMDDKNNMSVDYNKQVGK